MWLACEECAMVLLGHPANARTKQMINKIILKDCPATTDKV